MSSKKRKPPAEDPHPHNKSPSNGSPSPFAWTRDGVQVLLPSGRRLVVTGRGVLTVQSGEVDIAGSVLSASSGPVRLCGDADNGGAVPIDVVSTEATFPLAGPGGAALSIASCPPAGGGSRHARSFDVFLDGDPAALTVQDPLPAWRDAAAQLAASVAGGAEAGAPPAVLAVCGAKKVGKSSFARLLVNTLLNSHPCVAFLDTDCGQPEFTPPGLLSLSLLSSPVVGPPHCHQHQPHSARFFGDVSPQCDPGLYLTCIASLHRWFLEHCRTQGPARPPPLVVNTCGWIKGLGFDVLVDTLRALPLTHSVALASPNPRRNLPAGAFWGVPDQPPPPASLWLVPGLQDVGQGERDDAGGGNSGASALSAVEQRGLHWAAFAEACVSASAADAPAQPGSATPGTPRAARGGGSSNEANGAAGGEEAMSVGDKLAAAVPLQIDLADVAIKALHAEVPPAELARVLNGAVVGLCRSSEAVDAAEAPPCAGLGLVRAVDAAAGKAYILTDVPEASLERVDSLVIGRLELPPALLQTGRYLSPYLALFSLATTGTGAGASKSRNNLARASQL